MSWFLPSAGEFIAAAITFMTTLAASVLQTIMNIMWQAIGAFCFSVAGQLFSAAATFIVFFSGLMQSEFPQMWPHVIAFITSTDGLLVAVMQIAGYIWSTFFGSTTFIVGVIYAYLGVIMLALYIRLIVIIYHNIPVLGGGE